METRIRGSLKQQTVTVAKGNGHIVDALRRVEDSGDPTRITGGSPHVDFGPARTVAGARNVVDTGGALIIPICRTAKKPVTI